MALTLKPLISFKSQAIRKQLWKLTSHQTQHIHLPTRSITLLHPLPLPFNLYIPPIPHLHLPPLRPSLSPPMSSLASSSPPSDSSQLKTVRAVIKGRVQGVFYRNWTIENATELGLKGWVRNRRDGSVEALFSGSSDKVNEMEQRCRRGPRDAIVTGLEVFPSTDDPGSGFERRSTV